MKTLAIATAMSAMLVVAAPTPAHADDREGLIIGGAVIGTVIVASILGHHGPRVERFSDCSDRYWDKKLRTYVIVSQPPTTSLCVNGTVVPQGVYSRGDGYGGYQNGYNGGGGYSGSSCDVNGNYCGNSNRSYNNPHF